MAYFCCRDFISQLYSVTYMYYSLIGCVITVGLGWIVSWAVGAGEGDLYDQHLLHPAALRLSRMCPGAPRKYADKRTSTDANSNPAPAPKPQAIDTISSAVDTYLDSSDPPHGIYRTKL